MMQPVIFFQPSIIAQSLGGVIHVAVVTGFEIPLGRFSLAAFEDLMNRAKISGTGCCTS